MKAFIGRVKCSQKLLLEEIHPNEVLTSYSRLKALIRGDPPKRGVDRLFLIESSYMRRSTQMECRLIISDWKLLFEEIHPNWVPTDNFQSKSPIRGNPPILGVDRLFPTESSYLRRSTQTRCQLIIPARKLLFKRSTHMGVSTSYSQSKIPIQGDPPK